MKKNEIMSSDAIDAIESTKKTLEISINIVLKWKNKVDHNNATYHALLTDLILQAYAYRAHLNILLIEYKNNNHTSLSYLHISLIEIMLEFCHELNNHEFDPTEI